MFKKLSLMHWLMLLGGGFVAYKIFALSREEDDTSRSLDMLEDAIADLDSDEAFDEIEPEPEELDEMLEEVRY